MIRVCSVKDNKMTEEGFFFYNSNQIHSNFCCVQSDTLMKFHSQTELVVSCLIQTEGVTLVT